MSRYAVSLDVAEEIKKENKQKEESQKIDINLEQLKKKLEEPKQEFEHHQHDHSHHHHEHHEHEEEVHVTLDQLEKSLKEPKQTFTQPTYDYKETGGFFNFIKNHKILVFLILLMIFGYFYFNDNNQAIVNGQVSLQDASLTNIKNTNKNKSITVLDDILTTGLTVSE